jgi:hypothetical protein
VSRNRKEKVMTSKAVTTAQLEQIRKMAREKGIGLEAFQQYGLDDGIFADALDSVKQRQVQADAIHAGEAFWKSVGVAWKSNNFRSQFVDREILAGDGKTLTHKPLGLDMTGTEIVAHLGGAEAAVIAPADLRRFMDENRESPKWFVAVLEGVDGGLWVVYFYWHRDYRGWLVDADPVADSYRWSARGRALSRK